MHRRPLLDALGKYVTRDPEQAIVAGQFIRFVTDHPDCFERTLSVGHLTASACVIDSDRQQMLLVHHRKLDRWLQPGGHADGETDLLAVARKEVEEETGVLTQAVTHRIFDIDRHRIPETEREPEHWHYDVRFLLQADDTAPLMGNVEVNAARWFPIDEVSAMGEESVSRLALKVSCEAPVRS